MQPFVPENSIVRKIWGSADTILFIFAGASAEFALNKAVDWLYFTGRLPKDPLARLFSTVAYAQRIVFAEHDAALASIDSITAIHKNVEQQRGAAIPDWAYRDVLFMLIDYSIRSYQLLQRKLTVPEKEETFTVFYTIGLRMGLTGLPATYSEWEVMRAGHLQQNLIKSHYTKDLFKQYRKHLGIGRYLLLKQAQLLVIPARVRRLLSFTNISFLYPVVQVYKIARKIKLDGVLKNAVLPSNYKMQIRLLDAERR